MIAPRSVLHTMRIAFVKCRTENQNTHLMFSNFFDRISCRLSAKVENYGTAGQDTDDITTRRMRIYCWTTEVTNTHSE